MSKNNGIMKNQDYIIEITGQTHEGMGVGKIDDFAVFVAGAIAGEEVKVKVVKVLKNYSYGKLLEVITGSPNRRDPLCNVIRRCGGCQLQHMNYEGQLNFKKQVVKDALERIGGLKDVIIHDTLGMKYPWHYRNKSQLPVGISEKEIQIGFYAKRSHEMIDIDNCLIQDKIFQTAINIMKQFIKDYKISIYDENTGIGLIRHIILRKGFKTEEIMVGIVINGDGFPYAGELIEVLKQGICGLKTIVLNINKKKTNVIYGLKNKIIYGDGFIYDYIGDVKFRISLLSFFQVNPIQTKVLYDKVMEYAGLTGKETVIDAYCGIGTISLFLSRKAKKVYGVEVVEEAVVDAKENARLNGADNAEFILGEAEIEIPKLYERGVKADVIIVDPPRKGCDIRLLEVIAKMAPKKIIYVSCNPSTLARDLKYLVSEGYGVKEVQPVDLFAQTVHVEVTCKLTKVDN